MSNIKIDEAYDCNANCSLFLFNMAKKSFLGFIIIIITLLKEVKCKLRINQPLLSAGLLKYMP